MLQNFIEIKYAGQVPEMSSVGLSAAERWYLLTS